MPSSPIDLRDEYEAAACGEWVKDKDYMRGFRMSSDYEQRLRAYWLGRESLRADLATAKREVSMHIDVRVKQNAEIDALRAAIAEVAAEAAAERERCAGVAENKSDHPPGWSGRCKAREIAAAIRKEGSDAG